jgi:hypothetical protein
MVVFFATMGTGVGDAAYTGSGVAGEIVLTDIILQTSLELIGMYGP